MPTCPAHPLDGGEDLIGARHPSNDMSAAAA
jgi:hypothetical protein